MPWAAPTLFAGLQPQPPDGLLSLIRAFNDDPRSGKVDLGVGVYRTATGDTPVFAAVKAAEAQLLEEQTTKSYLGPEGNLGFLESVRTVAFGEGPAGLDLVGVQTPGGTGALRLAADLACAARPGACVWVGAPSWPIHIQIFARAGLRLSTYPHVDPQTGATRLDALLDAMGRAEAGDLFLLHGSCHNPTGADFTLED